MDHKPLPRGRVVRKGWEGNWKGWRVRRPDAIPAPAQPEIRSQRGFRSSPGAAMAPGEDEGVMVSGT